MILEQLNIQFMYVLSYTSNAQDDYATCTSDSVYSCSGRPTVSFDRSNATARIPYQRPGPAAAGRLNSSQASSRTVKQALVHNNMIDLCMVF